MRGSVRKRGKRWYYYFRITENGKRKQVERVGGNTRQEAQRALNLAIAEVETNNKFYNSNMTYSDYLDTWLENSVKLNCRSTTYNRYEATVRNNIVPELGSYKISKIEPILIQNFANKLLKKYKRGTAQNILGIVKKSLAEAVHPSGLIPSSPATHVYLPRDVKHDEVNNKEIALDLTETMNFISSFKPYSIHKTILLLGYYTGARRGEVLAMRWSKLSEQGIDIDKSMYWDKETGEYHLGPLKNKNSYRVLELPQECMEYLNKLKIEQAKNKMRLGELYEDNDFICKRSDGSYATHDTVDYILDKARMRDFEFNFKALRKLHASILLDAGVNIKAIQDRLGHASAKMTLDTYAKSTREAEAEVMHVLSCSLPATSEITGKTTGK